MSDEGMPEFENPPPPPLASDLPFVGEGNSKANGCSTAFGVVALVLGLIVFANRPSEATRTDPYYAGLGDFIGFIMDVVSFGLLVVGAICMLIGLFGRSIFRRRRR